MSRPVFLGRTAFLKHGPPLVGGGRHNSQNWRDCAVGSFRDGL